MRAGGLAVQNWDDFQGNCSNIVPSCSRNRSTPSYLHGKQLTFLDLLLHLDSALRHELLPTLIGLLQQVEVALDLLVLLHNNSNYNKGVDG